MDEHSINGPQSVEANGVPLCRNTFVSGTRFNRHQIASDLHTQMSVHVTLKYSRTQLAPTIERDVVPVMIHNRVLFSLYSVLISYGFCIVQWPHSALALFVIHGNYNETPWLLVRK
jgi:hypothetical protein